MRETQRFLKPELLAGMANLELRAATVVEGMMAGLHRSPYRGLSVEFADYRPYQCGDEPKLIDWRAFARSGHYYIKEYEEQTNLEATLVLDASASMDFGTGGLSKWQYAGTLAACLAYLLYQQQDAVGLVTLDESIRVHIKAQATRTHLMRMIGELEDTRPRRRTNLSTILHQVAEQTRRRGMILILSDLLDDPEAVMSGLHHLRFGGNDVILFHILDPAERDLPFDGPTVFVDPETSKRTHVLPNDIRAAYRQSFESFLNTYREETGKVNMTYVLAALAVASVDCAVDSPGLCPSLSPSV